jgi:hypothetical protein
VLCPVYLVSFSRIVPVQEVFLLYRKLVEAHPLPPPMREHGTQTGVDDGKKPPYARCSIRIPTREHGSGNAIGHTNRYVFPLS